MTRQILKTNRTTNIIAIAGLIISLVGNALQFNSNRIKAKNNEILEKRVQSLEKEIEARNKAYELRIEIIEESIGDFERENDNLNMRLSEGGIADRYDKLEQIEENKQEIKRLKLKLSEIQY